jgi:apolipoprotein N-acyltransferase
VWGITPRQAWLAQARLSLGESAERLDQPDTSGQGTPFFRYDKHHLVPFGEFVPPLFRWFVDLMAIPLGDFNRGRLGQAAFEWHGQRIAPNICYEDLFGEELARGFMHAGSAPTVLVNVSNLAWFGSTVALDQHLHISRLRALELGRSMVRATNTGATVVIDHEGRVTHAQPRQTAGVLVASVQGRTGLTPFAWWASRWGLWPVWWLAVVVLALTAVVRVRRRATDAGGTRP